MDADAIIVGAGPTEPTTFVRTNCRSRRGMPMLNA